jgi:hypothetical protein
LAPSSGITGLSLKAAICYLQTHSDDMSRSLDKQLPNLLPVSEGLCIMNSDIEARKAIVQRAIDRANSRGVPIDEDPTIVALLDTWVRGEIDARTMRLRYLESLELRASMRPS